MLPLSNNWPSEKDVRDFAFRSSPLENWNLKRLFGGDLTQNDQSFRVQISLNSSVDGAVPKPRWEPRKTGEQNAREPKLGMVRGALLAVPSGKSRSNQSVALDLAEDFVMDGVGGIAFENFFELQAFRGRCESNRPKWG